jgi:hypothetical protein
MRQTFILILGLWLAAGCATEAPTGVDLLALPSDSLLTWQWVLDRDMLESGAHYPPLPDSLHTHIPNDWKSRGQWEQIVVQPFAKGFISLVMCREESMNSQSPLHSTSSQSIFALGWRPGSTKVFWKELAFQRWDGQTFQTQSARIGTHWLIQTQRDMGNPWVTDSSLIQFGGF